MANLYEKLEVTSKTVLAAAKKSKPAYTTAQKVAAKQPNYAVEGLGLFTHALAQNEDLIRESEYQIGAEGMYFYATKGEEETVLAEVFLKYSGGKAVAFMTLGEEPRATLKTEEKEAATIQIALYPEAQEGDGSKNKVKAYDSRGTELSNQKFTLVDGKMTEVTPSQTQDGGQAQ